MHSPLHFTASRACALEAALFSTDRLSVVTSLWCWHGAHRAACSAALSQFALAIAPASESPACPCVARR